MDGPAMTSEALQTPSGTESFDRERERIHRQMLSSVSHDLKTPLASVIGSLEVFERMRDKLSEDKQKALIRVALQEAYRLDSFISNILDMAKLENSMVRIQRETVDINGIVRNCLLRLGSRLNSSTVEVKPLSGISIETVTDSTLLSRALYQVLDNAVKYGGAPGAILVEYGRNDDYQAFIRIRDNGRGIPPAQLAEIFSKYTRFAKEDQQNAGTGLGLAICRETMRLLGGSVSAESTPGNGALFTLSFPLG